MTYEAYAINLNHRPKPGRQDIVIDETTRYTGLPFTQVVRFQNDYYGVGPTGLFRIGGTLDHAIPAPTPIPWAIRTAISDLDVPFRKTVASAYFAGRFGPASQIDLYIGEDGANSYGYLTPRTDHIKNHRQAFGKGAKSRYFAIGVSGTSSFELDAIDLNVSNMTRRI